MPRLFALDAAQKAALRAQIDAFKAVRKGLLPPSATLAACVPRPLGAGLVPPALLEEMQSARRAAAARGASGALLAPHPAQLGGCERALGATLGAAYSAGRLGSGASNAEEAGEALEVASCAAVGSMLRRRMVRNAQMDDLVTLESEADASGAVVAGAGATLRRVAVLALRLAPLQRTLREEVLRTQAWVAGLNERDYRRFVRGWQRDASLEHEAVRVASRNALGTLAREAHAARRAMRERFATAREARARRHREVALFHSRAERAAAKTREVDQKDMMDALKANNIEAYREMLLRRAPAGADELDVSERAEALEGFLTQTERYVQTISEKVAAVKMQQQVAEAASRAAEALAARGDATVEEIESEGRRAAEAKAMELAATTEGENGGDTTNYYGNAHSVSEQITQQPKMLLLGALRPYQMVGLQWLVSLHNNKLNGILADEMGLGKTAQTLALLAYLMENRGNYGPHLIIVPNAVVINWKSEIQRWLGDAVTTLIYVGTRDERARLIEDTSAVRFNLMVTSYDFVMRDRTRLSKVEWKYIVIDEAQRMKDRESRLSRDLDRFSAERRLLLTGTPLQNDLMELWSLLNLLLPDVFDSAGWFADWFAKEADPEAEGQDAWLEQEKRTIVVHRLHQILEPFMLRRLVEDVEKRLPPKVSHVVHCRPSGTEAYIYQWVKWTSTARVDPLTASQLPGGATGARRNNWKSLQNRCMELRKVCNHPWLTASRGDVGALPAAPHRGVTGPAAVVACGKLHTLDRMLVKLHLSGHRVLLFSTMTKMLDILEDYVAWRFGSRSSLRIDGSTALEERETAINQFNAPDTRVFVFLLSIKAAGRGLNLQTSDTVVMYDPDPNPKAEEQAVARSHRIGQTREVRVFYLEALAPQEPEWMRRLGNQGGASTAGEAVECNDAMDVDADAPEAGAGGGGSEEGAPFALRESVEGIVRNTIQKRKIEMAEEIIDAGKFDLATSASDKKDTLERLLAAQAESNASERSCKAPSGDELNRMLARTDRELRDFERLDRLGPGVWLPPLVSPAEQPRWLRPSEGELVAALVERTASGKGVKATTMGESTEAVVAWAQAKYAERGGAAAAAFDDGLGRGQRGASAVEARQAMATAAAAAAAAADAGEADVVFPGLAPRPVQSLAVFDPLAAELALRRELGLAMGDSEHAAAGVALARLRAERATWPFLRAPTRKENHAYFKVVSQPVDLDFVEDNLARGRYAEPSELVADLRLMVANAERFHPEGTAARALVAELRAAVEGVVEGLLSGELLAAPVATAYPPAAPVAANAAAHSVVPAPSTMAAVAAVPLPEVAGSKHIAEAAEAAARAAVGAPPAPGKRKKDKKDKKERKAARRELERQQQAARDGGGGNGGAEGSLVSGGSPPRDAAAPVAAPAAPLLLRLVVKKRPPPTVTAHEAFGGDGGGETKRPRANGDGDGDAGAGS